MVKRQPPQFQKKKQLKRAQQPRRQAPKRTMDAWDILEWQGWEMAGLV